ncbi:glutathione S-transferase family protein [Bradyrhizobium sp. C-145]|jgi:glutathione S-transferase|uniref:glutathione S-transferase family protein n=1 Tax=Bradyrhizobium sp. C-145 TaxID=574727 RepID=UPI00201B88C1|nr:glutathione S-transferase family protein [Bradyrhizobium sp. C-145]UQR63082.1 glutathione S-transferase family protein [Bradyrhizobium sp. C-145]
MKLYWSPNSPYARKVVVVTKELRIDDRVKLIETSAMPTKENPELSALNPVTRIPTLQLNTGEVLFDSSLICEYLDEFSDGGLLPMLGPARRQVLKLELFGLDIMDRAVVCRQETLRPESYRWSGWVDAQFDRIGKVLDVLDANAPALDPDLGSITVGCALEYLDFRFGDRPWRSRRPRLTAWQEQFALRPSMTSTKHPQ